MEMVLFFIILILVVVAIIDICKAIKKGLKKLFGLFSIKRMILERKIVNAIEFNFFALTGRKATACFERNKESDSSFYFFVEEEFGLFHTNVCYFVGNLSDFTKDRFDSKMEEFCLYVLSKYKNTFVEVYGAKWADCNYGRLIFGNSKLAQSNSLAIYYGSQNEDYSFLDRQNTCIFHLAEDNLQKYESFANQLQSKLKEYRISEDDVAVFFNQYANRTMVEVFLGRRYDFFLKGFGGNMKKFSFVVSENTAKGEEIKNIISKSIENYDHKSRGKYGEILNNLGKESFYFDILQSPRFVEGHNLFFTPYEICSFGNYCNSFEIQSIEDPETALVLFALERIKDFKYQNGFLRQSEKFAFLVDPLLDIISLKNRGVKNLDCETEIREKAMKINELIKTSYIPSIKWWEEHFDIRIGYKGDKDTDKNPQVDIYLFHNKFDDCFRISLSIKDFFLDITHSLKEALRDVYMQNQYALYELTKK